MKTKLTILIEKDDTNLNITYNRKDMEKLDNTEDKLLVKYIESLIRYTIDNGFMSPKVKEEENGTEIQK